MLSVGLLVGTLPGCWLAFLEFLLASSPKPRIVVSGIIVLLRAEGSQLSCWKACWNCAACWLARFLNAYCDASVQCLLESLLDACRFAWQLLAERLLDTTLKVWWFGRKLFLWNASRALVMLVGARVECLQNLVTCMF